jgi:hypothetical protein
MAEFTPRAPINAIQQIGHLGIAAMRMVVRTENPIFPDRLPMAIRLGIPLSTETPSV